MTIGRILFATDFSRHAQTAFAYAVSLARAQAAALDILHVCCEGDWSEMEAESCDRLKAEVSAYAEGQMAAYREPLAGAGLEVRTHIEFGRRASHEVARCAVAWGAHLVVAGSRGAGGLKRLIYGSTLDRMLKLLAVPVMSVTENPGLAFKAADPATYVRFQRILVPVDFSDCSLSAVRMARRLGEPSGAAILLLHVLEDVFPIGFDVGMVVPFPNFHEGRLAGARQRLQQVADGLAGYPGGVATEVVPGVSALEILDRTQDGGYDLIVMGLHGRDFTGERFVGAVTDKVIRHAACPVLTMTCPAECP
jgi:nucleotide-binding universal stress UspA family protein